MRVAHYDSPRGERPWQSPLARRTQWIGFNNSSLSLARPAASSLLRACTPGRGTAEESAGDDAADVSLTPGGGTPGRLFGDADYRNAFS